MSEDRRFYRRNGDEKLAKISELIESENDPKVRAMLLTLQCIAEEVIMSGSELKNTRLVLNEHNTLLEAHDALMNKATTIWQVALWLLGLLQMGIVASGIYVFTNTETLKRDVYLLNNNQIRSEETLKEHVKTFSHLIEEYNDRKR